MNEYLTKINNVEYINLVFTVFSLSIWTLIIRFVIHNNKDIEMIHKPLLYLIYSIPFLLSLYDLFNKSIYPNILNYPPTYGYCFHKKDTDYSVGKFDLSCFLFQNNVVKTLSSQLISRFYYINYTILLISLIIEPLAYIVSNGGFNKYVPVLNLFKRKKILLKMLSITSIFSLIGYLAPIFSNSTTISMFIYKFIVVFLNINVSLLLLIFLVLIYNI